MAKRKSKKSSVKGNIAKMIEQSDASPKRKLATAKFMNSSYMDHLSNGLSKVINVKEGVDFAKNTLKYTDEQIISHWAPQMNWANFNARLTALIGAQNVINGNYDDETKKRATEFFNEHSEVKKNVPPMDLNAMTSKASETPKIANVKENILREAIRSRIVKLLKEKK